MGYSVVPFTMEGTDLPTTAGPSFPHGVFVVLPILNEAPNIAELLDRIERALIGRLFTVGILDDGSTDGTLAYIERLIVERSGRIHLIRRRKTLPGCQRGSALNALMHWGLAQTSHEFFVELDGDLSHQPEEMAQGLALLETGQFDVVIASKYLHSGREVERRPWRRFVSVFCSQLARTMLNRRIHDYSNGYRFYNRGAAAEIARHHTRNGGPVYLSEVLAMWLRAGMRITEFPSIYIGRQKGSSKVIFRDLIKAFLALLVIAVRYRVVGFSKASGERTTLSTSQERSSGT